MFIGLCRIALAAIAWSSVSLLIWFWGMSFLSRIETPPKAVSVFLKIIVHCVDFEFNCIWFFQKCFLKENYFKAGQKLLEFFVIGLDSSAVTLYEIWVPCFVGVYYGSLGLFFFLFLVLFASFVPLLCRRLNLFLVSVFWFERVDTFSCSCPVDKRALSILDCEVRLRSSQFRSSLGNLI